MGRRAWAIATSFMAMKNSCLVRLPSPRRLASCQICRGSGERKEEEDEVRWLTPCCYAPTPSLPQPSL